MTLAARLAKLELAIGHGDAPPALVILSADGTHDASGQVITLPPAGSGPRSVILRRGQPAPPRLVAADPPPPDPDR